MFQLVSRMLLHISLAFLLRLLRQKHLKSPNPDTRIPALCGPHLAPKRLFGDYHQRLAGLPGWHGTAAPSPHFLYRKQRSSAVLFVALAARTAAGSRANLMSSKENDVVNMLL